MQLADCAGHHIPCSLHAIFFAGHQYLSMQPFIIFLLHPGILMHDCGSISCCCWMALLFIVDLWTVWHLRSPAFGLAPFWQSVGAQLVSFFVGSCASTSARALMQSLQDGIRAKQFSWSHHTLPAFPFYHNNSWSRWSYERNGCLFYATIWTCCNTLLYHPLHRSPYSKWISSIVYLKRLFAPTYSP